MIGTSFSVRRGSNSYISSDTTTTTAAPPGSQRGRKKKQSETNSFLVVSTSSPDFVIRNSEFEVILGPVECAILSTIRVHWSSRHHLHLLQPLGMPWVCRCLLLLAAWCVFFDNHDPDDRSGMTREYVTPFRGKIWNPCRRRRQKMKFMLKNSSAGFRQMAMSSKKQQGREEKKGKNPPFTFMYHWETHVWKPNQIHYSDIFGVPRGLFNHGNKNNFNLIIEK